MKKTIIAALVLAPLMSLATSTPLENVMSNMAKDFKVITRNLNDPAQSAAVLSAVRDLEAIIPQAEEYVPQLVQGAPDQDVKVADYKKDMESLLAVVRQLEDALVKSDSVKAQQLVTQIGQMKQAGHEKFKKP